MFESMILDPAWIHDYHRELVDFFHGYDLPVLLHACGGVTEALPLIVEAGFDALNPMQVAAGCDVVRYAEEYGEQLAFIGGLDKMVYESGDRDLMKREVNPVPRAHVVLRTRRTSGPRRRAAGGLR